jgi:hypothetical protein
MRTILVISLLVAEIALRYPGGPNVGEHAVGLALGA